MKAQKEPLWPKLKHEKADRKAYYDKDVFEKQFTSSVAELNKCYQNTDWVYMLKYYPEDDGAVTLIRKNTRTGVEVYFLTRFYYDKKGMLDYDAFEEVLNGLTSLLEDMGRGE